MRTDIEIGDKLMQDVLRYTGARTKSEAVERWMCGLRGCTFQPDCCVLGGDVVLNRCALTAAAAFFFQSMAPVALHVR